MLIRMFLAVSRALIFFTREVALYYVYPLVVVATSSVAASSVAASTLFTSTPFRPSLTELIDILDTIGELESLEKVITMVEFIMIISTLFGRMCYKYEWPGVPPQHTSSRLQHTYVVGSHCMCCCCLPVHG